MASRHPTREGLRLVVAADLLERFLWVAYRPYVAAAIDAIDRNAEVTAALAAPLLPVGPPVPLGFGRERKEEEIEARGLAALVSHAFDFVDRVSDNPDVVFRAVFQNLYDFARQNLLIDNGWFDDSNVTGSRQSETGQVAYRWMVEDEDSGNITARFLGRSLLFNCEAVLGSVRQLDVSWRRGASTTQAAWAEGASGPRDVRFVAAADGTAELTIRGDSVPASLQIVEAFAAALDRVSVRIESMDSLVSTALTRTFG